MPTRNESGTRARIQQGRGEADRENGRCELDLKGAGVGATGGGATRTRRQGRRKRGDKGERAARTRIKGDSRRDDWEDGLRGRELKGAVGRSSEGTDDADAT